MAKMTIKYLKPLNTLVIKNEEGRGLFISTSDSLIITIASLANLLRYLLFKGFVSPEVLEGLLEEYNTFKGDLKLNGEDDENS
jgi:hypothetical protein